MAERLTLTTGPSPGPSRCHPDLATDSSQEPDFQARVTEMDPFSRWGSQDALSRQAF